MNCALCARTLIGILCYWNPLQLNSGPAANTFRFMSTLRTKIFRTWTVTFAVLRFCARLGIGLLGVYWLIAGVVGAVALPFVGGWGGAVAAMLYAFIGWSLAYGAFKWWPWEALPVPEPSSSAARQPPMSYDLSRPFRKD